MPADYGKDGACADSRRLGQLAQALCGCWVDRLPNSGLSRLLGAIMTGNEFYDDRDLGFTGSRS